MDKCNERIIKNKKKVSCFFFFLLFFKGATKPLQPEHQVVEYIAAFLESD